MFKGAFLKKDMHDAANKMLLDKKGLEIADFVTIPIKLGRIESKEPSLLTLQNDKLIVILLKQIAKSFDKLYAKRAFVSWHVSYSSESEMMEAREDIAAKIYDWQYGGVEVNE